MDEYLGEFAPDDWLSPEDVRRLTTDNTSLRAHNQELQESLSASTSEVTRLQGVIHDNTSLRARNQELQESLSASMSEVTRLQGVIHNQEQVRASMDRAMYDINLANQARHYESKLQAMQETNAQLAKEIERLEIRKKSFVDPYIKDNMKIRQENTALSAQIKELHARAKGLVDPYIQDNVLFRQENTALSAKIKELHAEYAVRQKHLSDRNAALSELVKQLRSTESLYETCTLLRGAVSALKAAN